MKVVVRYKAPENDKLLPSEDMYFKFDFDVDYTQTSGNNQTVSIKPKVTEVASSAADFANILENHKEDELVVRINNDIDLTEYEALNIEGNTIIEFNGHTLTTAPNAIKAVNGGVLTLEDSTGKGGITADRGALVAGENGTLIINGGTYTTTNNSRGSGINAKNGSKIIINNGVINAAYYAIGSDGTIDVTINGGELNSTATSKNGTWAYSVSIANGNFTMNGGKISGIHGGLAILGQTNAVVNNGEIYVHDSDSTSKDAYYDFYLEGTPTLKVHNGTFINDGTRSVIYTKNYTETEHPRDTEIYGGKFIAKGTTLFTGNSIKIAGGKFSHDVSSLLESGTLTLDENTKLYNFEA